MVYNIKKNQLNIKYNTYMIGMGTYGYVYKPSFFSKSLNYITKVFYDEENNDEIYNIEKKSIEELLEIDPYNLFTLKYQPIVCDNNEIYLLNSNIINILNKKILKQFIFYKNIKNNINLRFLNFEYGGKHIDKMNKINFETFWDMLYVLVKGIVHMNKFFIHRDIKESNILFTTKKFNLIDFGLRISKDNIFNKTEKIYLDSIYPYYPPEFRLSSYFYSKIFKKDIVSGQNLLKELQLFFKNSTTNLTYIEIYENSSINIHKLFDYCLLNLSTKDSYHFYKIYKESCIKDIYYLLKKFTIFLESNEVLEYKTIEEIIKNFFKNKEDLIDIYSLGMTLWNMIYKIENKQTFCINLNKMDEKKHINNLKNIIREMLRENVFERINGIELLEIIQLNRKNNAPDGA
jgi:serine/threonine protein kinase